MGMASVPQTELSVASGIAVPVGERRNPALQPRARADKRGERRRRHGEGVSFGSVAGLAGGGGGSMGGGSCSGEVFKARKRIGPSAPRPGSFCVAGKLLRASKQAPTRPPFTRPTTLPTPPPSHPTAPPPRSFSSSLPLGSAPIPFPRQTTASRDPVVNGAGQPLAIVSPSAAGLPHTEAPRRGRRPVGALCKPVLSSLF